MKKKLIKALSIVLGATALASCGDPVITTSEPEAKKSTTEDDAKEETSTPSDYYSESTTSSYEESSQTEESHTTEEPVTSTTSEQGNTSTEETTTEDITTTTVEESTTYERESTTDESTTIEESTTTSAPLKEYAVDVKLSSTYSTIKVELSNFSNDFKSLAEFKVLLKKDGEVVKTLTGPVEELATLNFEKLLADTQYTIEVYASDVLVETKTVSTSKLLKFDAKLTDANVVYDGLSHKILVEGNLPENAKVSYENNEKTDAGVYEVKAVVELEGYETLTLTAKLTITKANQAYEEALPTELLYGESVLYNSSLPFAIVIGENKIDAVYDEDLKLYVAQFVLQAGENKYKLVSEGTNNITGLDVEKELTAGLLKFEGLKFESATEEYDGEEYELLVKNLPEGATVEYTSNKATNAGVYEAVAKVSKEGYETETLTATLTINKAKVYFNKVNHPSKVYYKDTLVYSANVPFTATLVDANGKEEKYTASLSEDGLYKAYVLASAIGKVDVVCYAEETENYLETTWTHKQFTINQLTMKASATISGDDLSKNKDKNTKNLSNGGNTTGLIGVYSGNEYTVKFDSNVEFNVYFGDTVVSKSKYDSTTEGYSATISQKEVGEYTYTIKPIDEYGVKAYSATFKLTVVAKTQAKVEKNIDKVPFIKEGYDLVLSQDALNGNGFTVTKEDGTRVDAILNEETKQYEYKEHIVNAGSYVYQISSEAKDGWAELAQTLGATIQKAATNVQVTGYDDFTFDGETHQLKYVSDVALTIEVNKGLLNNISTTEGEFVYVVDTTYAGIYDVVVLKDDNYSYNELYKDFTLTVSKNEEVVTVTLDGSDSLNIQADDNDHELLFKAKLPFIVFDEELNETVAKKAEDSEFYTVKFTLRAAATYEYTWEYVNKSSFVIGSDDVKSILLAEALPEFSYSLNESTETEIVYDGVGHDVLVKETNAKDYVVELLFEHGSKSDTKTITATNGEAKVTLLDAGTYTLYVTCGNYTEEKVFVVTKADIPFNVYEVVDNNGSEELSEYEGAATKTNNFVVKSNVEFMFGEAESKYNETTKLYEVRVEVKKSAKFDVLSLNENYNDKDFSFNIILPSLEATVFVKSGDEYVSYDGSETEETNFEIRSKVQFKIGDSSATLNETLGLYVLDVELKKSQEVELVSLDEYFANGKVSVTVKAKAGDSVNIVFSEKNTLEKGTLKYEDFDINFKVTQKQGTGDFKGFGAGSSKKIGAVEFTFVDKDGNAKNIKNITVVISAYPKGGIVGSTVANAFDLKINNGETLSSKSEHYEAFIENVNSNVISIKSNKTNANFIITELRIEWE